MPGRVDGRDKPLGRTTIEKQEEVAGDLEGAAR
jgi:hypothetical protein